MQEIFEANSSFHMKLCTMRKVQFLLSKRFLLAVAKLSYWGENWGLENNSMKFSYFPDMF